MNKFKLGDKVLCILPQPNEGLESKVYTVKGYQTNNLITLEEIGGCYAWFDNRFELVKEEVPHIKFKLITWDEWTTNILKYIKEKIDQGDMDLEDMLYSPFLDFKDPKPFCEHHMFNGIYNNRVMVEHYIDRNCYWYINSDETILIYNPQIA